jgi:HD superfamily phosphohydrolase
MEAFMAAVSVRNTKLIFDPLWGIIDISEFLPMIDTPQFQELGFKYQLGVTSLLFPAATHTRKQHSFGALKRTQDLTTRWTQHGMITLKEARTLNAFALWHDLGHGPFSHVVEAVTKERFGRDHDQNGALIIDKLRPAVEAAGIEFKELKKLFTHENKLYLGVHDKNLGSEKLDYLARDAYYTLGEQPGVEYLAGHTYFIDGQIMVDEKVIDQAKSIQEFYIKMYKLVYLRKNSAIAQRMIQKMTAELMKATSITEDRFWSLTDFGLMGLFETSASPVVQDYYAKFMRRDLPKTAVSFRPEAFADMDTKTDKAHSTLSLTEDEMNRLTASPHLSSPSALEKVETQIERLAGLPAHTVVVLPPTSPERFVPQDITIYTRNKPAKLSDYYGDHFRALREEGLSYMALRICTFEPYRQILSRPVVAQTIKSYLLSLLKTTS